MKSKVKVLLARLWLLWRFLRSQEPARVQGWWRALVGIAVAAGVTVPDWVDLRVAGVIAAVYALLALTQAEQTRARVVPAENVPRDYHSETPARP